MQERYSQDDRNVYGAEDDAEMDAIMDAIDDSLANLPNDVRHHYAS